MGPSKGHRFDHNVTPPQSDSRKTLSHDMLNGLHREGIGLVAHGPAHMALMCGLRSSLRHEVSNHVKGWAKRGIDSTKLNMLTHEMNPQFRMST